MEYFQLSGTFLPLYDKFLVQNAEWQQRIVVFRLSGIIEFASLHLNSKKEKDTPRSHNANRYARIAMHRTNFGIQAAHIVFHACFIWLFRPVASVT